MIRRVDTYLSASEAAARLGIDVRTLTRWTEAGRITARRTPGGHRRYAAADVDALLR